VRLGVDTNVLVHAHVAASPMHERVHAYLRSLLVQEGIEIVLSPLVLHEFLHVVTDARRFDPPIGMPTALRIAQGYLGRSNVVCAAIGESTMARAFELMRQHRLGRRRIADTLWAAALLEEGVHRLVTCNPRDYAVFDDLDTIDPCADTAAATPRFNASG